MYTDIEKYIILLIQIISVKDVKYILLRNATAKVSSDANTF